MKCNQSRPEFELESPCPFPTTITITPRALPASGGVMVSKLDWQILTSEFDSPCVPHLCSLVLHLSKMLRKLNVSQKVLPDSSQSSCFYTLFSYFRNWLHGNVIISWTINLQWKHDTETETRLQFETLSWMYPISPAIDLIHSGFIIASISFRLESTALSMTHLKNVGHPRQNTSG